MICNKCGAENDNDSIFCIKCGSRMPRSSSNKTEDVLFIPEQKSHVFRNIILVGVVATILFIILAAVFSDSDISSTEWTNFHSIEHNFSVDLPEYPETEREPPVTADNLTYSYTQYSAGDSQDGYLVQAADYDIAPYDFDNKTGLEGYLNGIIEGGDMKLDQSNFGTYKGFDAIEYTFSYFEDNIEYYGKGISFIQDDMSTIKLFTLMIVSEFDSFINYDKFINSFELN